MAGSTSTNSNEIGTQAGRIFEYMLPANWIFRSQEDQNDFGIDGEIELKSEDGKAIGRESVFKVQIKGEGVSSFIEDGKILSFTLSLERLRYYFDFRIPLILFVVETSTDGVYWLAITDNTELAEKAAKAEGNKKIQVHIPTINKIGRRDVEQAKLILEAVTKCWDYLVHKGLKSVVDRYPRKNLSEISQTIEDINHALFNAYHQRLDLLFKSRDFDNVYKQAKDLATSNITPLKEKFVAILYYWQAFQIAPHTNIKAEEFRTQCELCFCLVSLAKECKNTELRYISIGKARKTAFKHQLDQLHASYHTHKHFSPDSTEYVLFKQHIQQFYRQCCHDLQKLIELCNRLIRREQYNIFADLYADIASLIATFKTVHKDVGVPESIEFLDSWNHDVLMIATGYCVLVNDTLKLERLYRLQCALLKIEPSATKEMRELILKWLPQQEESLDKIEATITSMAAKSEDFYELSIEEQKKFFTLQAKNLGMDPDDPDNEIGTIVAHGLINYDPTNIMKGCENMFVHYRAGGLPAQMLRMHSMGGMHLLVCIKHRYARGTGALLTECYDNVTDLEFMKGFKQTHCDNCSNCTPRPTDWRWDLAWYTDEVTKHKDLLNQYRF